MQDAAAGFLLASAAVAGAMAVPAWAVPEVNPISGGLGGRIIRVTTLKPDGPGSFSEAVKAKGPRIVVFEVGGVIDLGRESREIKSGDITIAGQTAPSLVTFIRGGIAITRGQCDRAAHRGAAGRGGASEEVRLGVRRHLRLWRKARGGVELLDHLGDG